MVLFRIAEQRLSTAGVRVWKISLKKINCINLLKILQAPKSTAIDVTTTKHLSRKHDVSTLPMNYVNEEDVTSLPGSKEITGGKTEGVGGFMEEKNDDKLARFLARNINKNIQEVGKKHCRVSKTLVKKLLKKFLKPKMNSKIN